MKNAEIASIFFEIADILEMRGIQWKPRAYRKAAMAIQSMAVPVESVYGRGGRGALKAIPGVGENIAKKIEEIIRTGRLGYHEKLKKSMPIDVEALASVPGLGPKKLLRLYRELGVKSLADLEKAALQHKIRQLHGFGEKTEKEILAGIGFVKKAGKRILLGVALPVASEVKSYLERSGAVRAAEPAGSLRRRMETIGDIDILVASTAPEKVMGHFTSMPSVKKVLAVGRTKASVRVESSLQVDVRVVRPGQWGSALQYFTGSKQHSIELRKIAMRRGLKLSEYGVFRGKRLVASRTERDVYAVLGLPFIEPELRENRGEIEAALHGRLPKLLKRSDVRGDFQTHTVYSDGNNSIEEMAASARLLGHSFIAITDHVGALTIAHAMNEKTVRKQFNEIDRLQKKFPGLRILKGMEVDIKKSGELNAGSRILRMAEVVYGSIHHGFRGSERENTHRVCRALENRYLSIMGHPTNRKIGKREPLALDLGRIFEKARENNVALEVNGMPERLDLNDANARAAVEAGCLLALGTDAHNKSQLRYIDLAVATARRGWAEKKNVINTFGEKKLDGFLQR
jgi:DNA polymerase (family 10)